MKFLIRRENRRPWPWVGDRELGEVFRGPLARAAPGQPGLQRLRLWTPEGGQLRCLPGASFGAGLPAAEDTRPPARGRPQGSTWGQASPALISGLFLFEAPATGQFSWEQICGAVPIWGTAARPTSQAAPQNSCPRSWSGARTLGLPEQTPRGSRPREGKSWDSSVCPSPSSSSVTELGPR